MEDFGITLEDFSSKPKLRFCREIKSYVEIEPRQLLTPEQRAENKRQYDREYAREYYHKNKEQKREYNSRPETKSLIKKRRPKMNAYIKKKRREDVNYRMSEALRKRVIAAVRGAKNKKGKTAELIGCSVAFLKEHLEAKFQEGMTWENYGWGEGKWVIDHIVPLALFPDLSQEWQQKSALNWQNLQPLWWRDNMIKGNKLETCPV